MSRAETLTADFPQWAWIAVDVLAAGSCIGLGWQAWKVEGRTRELALIPAFVGLQLPLAGAGLLSGGLRGAFCGLIVGVVFCYCLLALGVLLVAIYGGLPADRQRWFDLRDLTRVVAWGCTALMLEMLVVPIVRGGHWLIVLQGVGTIGGVWLMDCAVRSSWMDVADRWVERHLRNNAVAIYVIVMVAAIGVTPALRFGGPDGEAINAYVTAHLGVHLFHSVAELFVVMFAIIGVTVSCTKLYQEQRRLLVAGCASPLLTWLLAAALLPPQAGDFAVWGLLVSGFFAAAGFLSTYMEGAAEPA